MSAGEPAQPAADPWAGWRIPSAHPELVAGPAVRDVLALRLQQISDHGHTLDQDLAAPDDRLPRLISDLAVRVREDQQFDVDRAVRRRHLVKLAALCLAAIDVLDAKNSTGPKGEADVPQF